ncbi:MAG: hypothetical protein WD738_21580 [Pirellulales bacterium]
MLEERRRQLKDEFAKGVANREKINLLLNLSRANVEDDLRAVVALADTMALRLLRMKLRHHQVVRRRYRGPLGTGCLTHYLLGFTSNDDLLNFPYESESVLDSACRTVRAWDYGQLDEESVLRILSETIRGRLELNALEDAAVRRSADQTAFSP